MSAELLWLDCEMDWVRDHKPDADKIWEVAAIATDFSLQHLGSYHSFVRQPASVPLAQRDNPWWQSKPKDFERMVLGCTIGQPESVVDSELRSFSEEHFPNGNVILAGSSIGVDKRRIETTFPSFFQTLGHRVLDVSSLRIWAQGTTGATFEYPGRPQHRAMYDIETSMQELQFWSEVMRTLPTPSEN